MFRGPSGAWLLDHSAHNVVVGLWSIDPKDVYTTVEEFINHELSNLVNEVMFDDSVGNPVSEM